MATQAEVLADAADLQAVLSEVTTQIARGYGNIAAGKLNRVGQGLTSLIEGIASIEEAAALAAPSAAKGTYVSPTPPPKTSHSKSKEKTR